MEKTDQYECAVCAVGFSDFEKSTMEMFFRLTTQSSPRWKLVECVDAAKVLLLNVSESRDIDDWRPMLSPQQKVLIIGSSDFGTGWPFVPRPIRLTVVIQKLAVLSGVVGIPVRRVTPTAAPVNANRWTERGFQKTEPGGLLVDAVNERDRKAQTSAQVSPRDALPERETPPARETEREVDLHIRALVAPQKRVSPPPASESAPVAKRVLVVDDSDVALKFMQSRLRHFGYESQLARSGEEALTLVASQRFKFVFLDVMMAGLDGYQTCRAIKQSKSRRGSGPVVVMLTSRSGTIDKIRGSMAGCDAYLTKPLSDRQLASVLVKYDAEDISTFGKGTSVPGDSGSRFASR